MPDIASVVSAFKQGKFTAQQLRLINQKLKELAASGKVPDIWEPYLEKPKSSVTPIFGGNERGSELLGSGVLMKIDTDCFLLTAAHVCDHRHNYDLLIPGKENITSLYGDFHHMRMPRSGDRNDDRYDIAFFRLDKKLSNGLDADLTFLEIEDVDLFDATCKGDAYTLVGFPVKKSRTRGQALETEQISLSGEGTKGEVYRKFQMSIQHHMAIRFRKKKAISYKTYSRSQAPQPNGMSGGGIFAWSKQLPDPAALSQPRLEEILTEYHRQDNLFLGTRLNCYISCIAKKYPSLPIFSAAPIDHDGNRKPSLD